MLAAAAALLVVAGGGTAAVRALHRPPAVAEVGSIIVKQSSVSDVKATPASALPVYVAARQRGRVVLFREFRTVRGLAGADAQVGEAVRLALTQNPLDADYVQLFSPSPAPTVRATVTPQTISVDISPAPRPRYRPVTPDEAKAAVTSSSGRPRPRRRRRRRRPGPPPPSRHRRSSRRCTSRSAAGRPVDVRDLPGRSRPEARGRRRRPARGCLDHRRRRRQPAQPGLLSASGDAVAVDDAQVLVVLRRNGDLVRSEDVPLTASEASSGTRPPRPGERGGWSIRDWDATKPGTYTLEVYAPASLTAPVGTPAPALSPPARPTPASAAYSSQVTVDADDHWTDTKTFTVR